MRLNKRLFAALLLAWPSLGWAGAAQVFSGGATYPIIERDALEEIQERAAKADVAAFVNQKPRSEWSVWRGHELPRATEDRIRGYVPWYTLEFDITGPNGEVIYPKGFTFNPLQYLDHRQRIVIFKLDQLDKIKALLKPGDMLIADSGDVVEAGRQFGKHIYILRPELAKRLGVTHAPSFIVQKGAQFQIREVKLSDD